MSTSRDKLQAHEVAVGSVGGTPIVADPKGVTAGLPDPWALVKVQLTANYTPVNPPGLPDRPPAGVAAGSIWTGAMVPFGAIRFFHAFEAQALIAAGAAVLHA